MSAKLMGQVYELQLNHSQQSIALALADHAHDDGTHIYPGIEYLEWKTGYSQRNIIRILADLENIGLIEPVGGQSIGRGNVQEYQMITAAVAKKEPYKRDKVARFTKGDKLSKGDKRDIEKVTNETVKGDKRDIAYIEDRAPVLTIIEPSMEPSVDTARAESFPKKWEQISKTPEGLSLADVCAINPGWGTPTQFWEIEQNIHAIIAMGATPELLEEFKTWWKLRDWRGQKGKKPKPDQVRAEWMKFVEDFRNGNHNQPEQSKRAKKYERSLIYR